MFAKIKMLYALWKNPIFHERYVKQNIIARYTFPIASWVIISQKIKRAPWKAFFLLPFYIFWRFCDNAERRNFSGRAAFNKIKNNPLCIFYFPAYLYFYITRGIAHFRYSKYFWKPYLFLRLFFNKIDIPKFDFVVTSRCTLNCAGCNSLMPYFQTEYTSSIDGFKKTLDVILKNVASIRNLYIVGGEPLMFKELYKMVDYLNNQPKVKFFTIITNGTLKPQEDLLKSLIHSRGKSQVSISDYSKASNIHTRLQKNEIVKILEENQIQYIVSYEDNTSEWIDFGKIYKRGRDKAGIIKNFRCCLNPCIAVRSNEPGFNSEGGVGQYLLCQVASSLSRLKGLKEFEGDFIVLNENTTPKDFIHFYAQDFFKACDYCHDMWQPRKFIPIAIQTKEVLKLEP